MSPTLPLRGSDEILANGAPMSATSARDRITVGEAGQWAPQARGKAQVAHGPGRRVVSGPRTGEIGQDEWFSFSFSCFLISFPYFILFQVSVSIFKQIQF
jgi:hypothetical protein